MANLELSLEDLQTLTLLAAQAPESPQHTALIGELKSETARRIAEVLQEPPGDNAGDSDDPVVKTAEAIRNWVRRSRAMRPAARIRDLGKAREYAEKHFREVDATVVAT